MLAVRHGDLCSDPQYLCKSKVWCIDWGGVGSRQILGVQSSQVRELQVLWRDPVSKAKVANDRGSHSALSSTSLTSYKGGTVQYSSLGEELGLTDGWVFVVGQGSSVV